MPETRILKNVICSDILYQNNTPRCGLKTEKFVH